MTDLDSIDILLVVVVSNPYRIALDKANEDLAALQNDKNELLKRLDWLDKQIEQATESVNSLARVYDQQTARQLDPSNPMPLAQCNSLNDAVRFVMKTNSDKVLTPVEVRDKLAELGYNVKKYKSDPLSLVHTVLNRRLYQIHHEVQKIRLGSGRTGYKWITETDKIREKGSKK